MINKIIELGKKRKALISIIFAFTFSFLFQLHFNQFMVVPRNYPDEMGAVALAAKMAGFDWTYTLTHPAYYYGSLTFPFLYPFFVFIDNPISLYQCLIGVGAFIRSIPALISGYMLYRYWKIDNPFHLFFCGFICCILVPTRGTNIDNEPILLLLTWLIFWILTDLCVQQTKATWRSCLLAVILALSFLAHNRSIVFLAAVLCVMLLGFYVKREWIVSPIPFFICFLPLYIIVQKIIKFLQDYIYPVDAGATVKNTNSSLINSIIFGIKNIFSESGIIAFVDLLLSNILVIFVFGFGIFIFIILTYFKDFFLTILKKTGIEEKEDLLIQTFPIIVLIVGLVGLCVTWHKGALAQHLADGKVTRGYFYMRYYFLGAGELFLLFFVKLWKKTYDRLNIIKYMLSIIIFILACYIYVSESFLIEETAVGYNVDWFGYFAPFTLKKYAYNSAQDYGYFYISLFMAIIIFIFICLLIKKNRITSLLCMIMLMGSYYYSYAAMNWDLSYISSESYYPSVNAFIEYKDLHSEKFKEVDQIVYFGDKWASHYVLQFCSLDIPILFYYDAEKKNYPNMNDKQYLYLKPEEENVIFLTNTMKMVDKMEWMDNNYYYLELDENEILLIRGKEYERLFEVMSAGNWKQLK